MFNLKTSQPFKLHNVQSTSDVVISHCVKLQSIWVLRLLIILQQYQCHSQIHSAV